MYYETLVEYLQMEKQAAPLMKVLRNVKNIRGLSHVGKGPWAKPGVKLPPNRLSNDVLQQRVFRNVYKDISPVKGMVDDMGNPMRVRGNLGPTNPMFDEIHVGVGTVKHPVLPKSPKLRAFRSNAPEVDEMLLNGQFGGDIAAGPIAKYNKGITKLQNRAHQVANNQYAADVKEWGALEGSLRNRRAAALDRLQARHPIAGRWHRLRDAF